MLKFEKSEARRLIMGSAYQYKKDLRSPQITMRQHDFADAHGTPSQRFFNVLCIAYGADKNLFADFVSSGALPKDRAEYCEDEYRLLDHSMRVLLKRYVSPRLARQLHKNWLPPLSTRPIRRAQ